MSQETLFTNDLIDQSTFNRVRPTRENVRDYDQLIYRSFATVPLTISHPSGEWRLGVVALTSNQVGRFGDSNVSVAEQLGDVLAQALWLDRLASPNPAFYGQQNEVEISDGKTD